MRSARVLLLALALALCLSLAAAQFEHRCPLGSRVVNTADPCATTAPAVFSAPGKKCCMCPNGQYTTSQTAQTCTSCGISENGVNINLEAGTHQCGCLDGWGGWTHATKKCTKCTGSQYRSNQGVTLSAQKGACLTCTLPKQTEDPFGSNANSQCVNRPCGANEFRLADGVSCAACDPDTTTGVGSGNQCACKAGYGGFAVVQVGGVPKGKCQPCALNQWSVGGVGAMCGQCHHQHTEGTKDLVDGKRTMCSCKPGTGNAVYNNGQTAQCQPCPVGEFSVGGFLARCMKCSDMEGSMSPGEQSTTQCKCQGGYGDFALVGPQSVLDKPSHVYADENRQLTQDLEFKCTQCPRGKVSQETGEKPLGTCGSCPIGFNTYLPGQAQCVVATENCKVNDDSRPVDGLHFYFDIAEDICKACPAGRWNGFYASTLETPTYDSIPANRRRLLGFSGPVPCRYSANQGHQDPENADNSEMTVSLKGFTTDGEGSAAYKCAAPLIQEYKPWLPFPTCSDKCKTSGSYQDEDGQTKCKSCKWKPKHGDDRTFSNEDFTGCIQCQPGEEISTFRRQCVACKKNTFSSKINQDDCTPCDRDYATTFGKTGQTKCQCKQTYSRRFEQFKDKVLANEEVVADFAGALCRPHNCQPGQYYGKNATTGALDVQHGSCLPCPADTFCNSEVGCKECTACADHASTFGMEGQSECRCKNKAGMLPGWTSETAQTAFANDQIRSIGVGDAAPNVDSLDVDTISSGALCTPACKPGQWWNINDPSQACEACPANFYCPAYMTFGCSGVDGEKACLPCNGDVAESVEGATRCTCKQNIVLPEVLEQANVNEVTEFVDLDGSADGSGCLPIQWARR